MIGTYTEEVFKMNKVFQNFLRHIDKLPHIKKEQVYLSKVACMGRILKHV